MNIVFLFFFFVQTTFELVFSQVHKIMKDALMKIIQRGRETESAFIMFYKILISWCQSE